MNVFFFGDSISFGQFVSPNFIWVLQLSEQIHSSFRGLDIKIMNPSISGNTTRMALERMNYDVLSHGVDVIMIQYGMNDCNYWISDNGMPRVTKRAFEANLIEMIERSKNAGAKLIFLNTNHPTPKNTIFSKANISYQQSNKEYNEIIRSVAHETNVHLLDIELAWQIQLKNGIELDNLLLKDNIHLSVLGHKLYFDYISPLYMDHFNKFVANGNYQQEV